MVQHCTVYATVPFMTVRYGLTVLHGIWYMIHGVWCMVHGTWYAVLWSVRGTLSGGMHSVLRHDARARRVGERVAHAFAFSQ